VGVAAQDLPVAHEGHAEGGQPALDGVHLSALSTSMPRWLTSPGVPYPVRRESLRGGSSRAKFGVPGTMLGRGHAEEL